MSRKTKLGTAAIATFALTGLLGLGTAIADTTPAQLSTMIKQDASLNDCGVHSSNNADCHVHDENTFMHVRQKAPKPNHAHAWMELRNWNRHFDRHHR